jgi:hypothetical protein
MLIRGIPEAKRCKAAGHCAKVPLASSRVSVGSSASSDASVTENFKALGLPPPLNHQPRQHRCFLTFSSHNISIMKKHLLLLALAATSFSATAQSAAVAPAARPAAAAAPAGYTEMMAATIAELHSTGDPAQLKQIASKFERASAAAATDWLPQYYQAYALLINCFQSKENGDAKDKTLDQAEAALARARKLGGDETEVLVLQAYLHQARLGISPMMRSAKYSGLVTETLAQAKKLNPANPRIYLVQGNNLYFTPKMFGGGPEAAKPIYEEGKARFAAFKPSSALAPNWGERQLNGRLKSYEPASAQAAK